MSKTIEIVQVSASEDTIYYELRDNTGLQLLKSETVSAWIKFHNAACFDFSAKNLPEAILALPVTLYLLPATWFYGVELVVPSIDKVLHDCLPSIYATALDAFITATEPLGLTPRRIFSLFLVAFARPTI